ncbi:hypothetical protein Tco_0636014 [Tanacetum coccineum]
MVDGQLFEKLNIEYNLFGEDGGGGGMMVIGGCESICDGVSNWTSSGSIENEEVSLVDGVLEGALGALEALKMEALVDAMDVDNG